jgi:low affinity Fe/Cu permease
MSPGRSSRLFTRFAQRASRASGSPLAFAVAAGVIVAWAVTGPLFHFSDTWQLVINTSTTIVTFLMVFLIQNTQNRDTYALQIKLDELIRATRGAHDALLDLEELDEVALETMRRRYIRLAELAREQLRRGLSDTEVHELEAQTDAEHDRDVRARLIGAPPRRDGDGAPGPG